MLITQWERVLLDLLHSLQLLLGNTTNAAPHEPLLISIERFYFTGLIDQAWSGVMKIGAC